jgi:hypothetical protein
MLEAVATLHLGGFHVSYPLWMGKEHMDHEEEWRPVVGYEGYYEVSSLGQVRSIDRFVYHPLSTLLHSRCGRVLKAHPNGYGGRGHLQVILARGGKRDARRVHKLVAAAFLGPTPPGNVVKHNNDNRIDNSLANLSFGTPKENMADRDRNGHTRFGEAHGMAILTTQDVIDIRKASPAISERKLAAHYHVSRGAIHGILNGKNWKHVK